MICLDITMRELGAVFVLCSEVGTSCVRARACACLRHAGLHACAHARLTCLRIILQLTTADSCYETSDRLIYFIKRHVFWTRIGVANSVAC